MSPFGARRPSRECRELLRHAVNDEDQAFWQQAAERWEGTLRQIKQSRTVQKPHLPKRQGVAA
jgi:hypothetical protein